MLLIAAYGGFFRLLLCRTGALVLAVLLLALAPALRERGLQHALAAKPLRTAQDLPALGLTFEVSGSQRCAAWPRLQKMYTVPAAGAKWHAVGAPLDRGVRHP
jgi:hypothetical protein